MPRGSTPTVVVGANLVQPDVRVALHLAPFSTETVLTPWLDA